MKILNTVKSMLMTFSALLAISCVAQPSPSLIESLQEGGKVIVMRHASSPRQTPDEASAAEGNVNLERQLDAQGIANAKAMGQAFKRLGISFVEVGSSPTFRARETLYHAAMGFYDIYEELGNEGMRETGVEKAAWLREKTSKGSRGGNELYMTHGPNISAAFPEVGGTEEGEALVFDPEVSNTVPIGRITIEQWKDL